jgi:ZIP family zinc transporter
MLFRAQNKAMAFTDVFLGAATVLIATSAGAAFVFFFGRLGRKGNSALLGFSSGVMLFSAFEMFMSSGAMLGESLALAGALFGILALIAAERALPHVHARIRGRELAMAKNKGMLVAGAIAIHNIPEGFAIASAFAGSTPLGWLITASIALQDIPEGLMASAPFACYGERRERAFAMGAVSGVAEFAAAIAGYAMLSVASGITPLALAVSAGAMAFIVFMELLPDAFRGGMERTASVSLAAGFGLAFALASALA